MSDEPIKIIEIPNGKVSVYAVLSKYENDEGDLIATLPFPVDEKIAALALVAYECGHDKGYSRGHKQGRKDVIAFVHELLGIDKLVDRLGTIAEGV